MELETAIPERRYRKRKAHFIRVAAFDIKLDKQIRDLIIDINKYGKKDWLFAFVLWATCNGVSIEIEKEENKPLERTK